MLLPATRLIAFTILCAGSLLERNAKNVTVITATQYTGEEFFQGGLNEFKSKLENQLQYGLVKTSRKQVEVEQTDLAAVGYQQQASNQLKQTKTMAWKTIPILDSNGQEQREDNPLAQYGIAISQVLIGEPRPETALEKLLIEKKRLVAERIKAVQEQETSKARAKTEQLNKEIQRTREAQDAVREKEVMQIRMSREVEVAKLQAERDVIEEKKKEELAMIAKKKELSIAQAELDIQKAVSSAAVYAGRLASRARGTTLLSCCPAWQCSLATS